jgi:hypothetical protein
MTTAVEVTRPATEPVDRLVAWLGGVPLAAHVVALALVLAIGLVVTGPRVAYSSDEGVAVLQARMLRDGQGWLYHSPLRRIDPEDEARPFVRGDLGSKGVAPYAKHPLYPVVLAGFDAVGGDTGMHVAGALGTLLAALLAALLARSLGSRLDRVVLWLVAVASPLFFDSYVVLAHSLAAAAVAAGVLLAVLALRPGRGPRRRALAAGSMLACLTVASMLRTEALFVGPAVAAACVVVALAQRVPWRRAVIVGAAAVVASALAWGIDRTWSRAILGTPRPGVPNAAPASWLAGRWDAFHTTWLQASYAGGRSGDLALELGATLFALAALLLHRRDDRRTWVAAAVVAAALCYVVRLIVGPVGSVPGLALAFPAGWFLLWAAGRRIADDIAAPVLAVVAGAVTFAVLVTQYAIGGGVEWGGRYFAIMLPIAVPVLTFAAAPVVVRHGRELARIVVAALVIASLAATLTAVEALRTGHRHTADVLDAIAQDASRTGTSGGLARPVVVTTNRLLPQIDYRDFGHYDWVAVDANHLERSAQRLVDLGVREVVLVTPDQAGDLASMPGWSVVRARTGLPLDVLVLRAPHGGG